MKWSLAILWPVLIIGPIFLQVLFYELSGIQQQLQDAFIYEQLITDFSQMDISDLSSAPGVHIVCIFPNNTTAFSTGENSVILVAAKNKGKLPIQLFGIRAYICRPDNPQHPVQDFKIQLSSWIVPPTYTATWEYNFSVSQSVKDDVYKLVGNIMYATEEDRYQNTFYNGSVAIIEAHDPIMVVDVIVSGLLGMFYICICVYAYCVINNGVIKKVKKFLELADIPRPRTPRQGNRRGNR